MFYLYTIILKRQARQVRQATNNNVNKSKSHPLSTAVRVVNNKQKYIQYFQSW